MSLCFFMQVLHIYTSVISFLTLINQCDEGICWPIKYKIKTQLSHVSGISRFATVPLFSLVTCSRAFIIGYIMSHSSTALSINWLCIPRCFLFFSIQVDTYGTVQPHTLIRQHLDYNHWYDRAKLSLKEVHNCQYVACMNPTAGSFTINPRLQRHFAVFAISFPGLDALKTIYLNILNGHINAAGLPQAVQKNSEKLVDAAVAMNQKVRLCFI